MVPLRLSAHEERDLVIAAERGDREATQRLVETYLPAIANIARNFRGGKVERGDLIQEGVAGLLFAARRYDPALNTPFWAYASFWVRKAMQELVAELTWPTALSDRAARDLAHVRNARRDHLREHGSEPSDADLRRATGFSADKLADLQATERIPQAMEQHVGGGGDSTFMFADAVDDPSAERAYEHVLDRLELREVRDLTDALQEPQRSVIRAHYGLGEPPQTLAEIGARLGVTAERARQIEAAGLAKLRDALARTAAPPSNRLRPSRSRLTTPVAALRRSRNPRSTE